jgi:hypothetical protein
MNVDPTVITIAIAVVQGALALFGTLIGWLVKGLFARMKSLEEAADAKVEAALTELRVSLAERYVSKADHKEALDAIFAMLRRIEDKLDDKADKP